MLSEHMGEAGSNHQGWLSPTEGQKRSTPDHAPDIAAARDENEPIRYGFTIGNFGLLIPPNCISEVIKSPPIYRIPSTPPWLDGLVNLRGNLIPAFDLALMLEEKVVYERSLLLVVDRCDWATAVKIGEFPQPLQVALLKPGVPPLPTILADHVTASYMQDATVWLEFDHRAFFQTACQRVFGASH